MSASRLLFRHGDLRFPFAWEGRDQPSARWHAVGDGPAQYLSDTPDGAWAEFIRHEAIIDPADLAGVERRLWAVEVPLADLADARDLTASGISDGDLRTYDQCRQLANDARVAGYEVVKAKSAALPTGGARGQRTDGGLVEGPKRDGENWVLFGRRPHLVGWLACDPGRPSDRQLRMTVPLVPIDVPVRRGARTKPEISA